MQACIILQHTGMECSSLFAVDRNIRYRHVHRAGKNLGFLEKSF